VLGVGHREIGVLLHLPRHLHDPRLSPVILQQLVMPLLQGTVTGLYNAVINACHQASGTMRIVLTLSLYGWLRCGHDNPDALQSIALQRVSQCRQPDHSCASIGC